MLIFDLGGRTCDVSVLTTGEGIFEVKATGFKRKNKTSPPTLLLSVIYGRLARMRASHTHLAFICIVQFILQFGPNHVSAAYMGTKLLDVYAPGAGVPGSVLGVWSKPKTQCNVLELENDAVSSVYDMAGDDKERVVYDV
ncbi:hypothetical protein M405DRAFT_882639, partial [Rhizopogon salebrosus TDB-379]